MRPGRRPLRKKCGCAYGSSTIICSFLERVEVPATNNLAERQLRPAVIARKISCGNKTEKGARAWAVLASLAATCQQKGKSFIQFVAESVLLQPTRAP